MKSLLKNLGLILMIIGAAILVGVFFTGSAAINDNGVLGGSAALIVIGLIVYIVLNKRIVDSLIMEIILGKKDENLEKL